jgi:hypothetical protein
MSSARSATAALAAMSLAVAMFPAAILAAETEAVSSGFETPAVTVIEGEAAGAYPALDDRRRGAARSALERFRRTFVRVAGRCVLVLDDLRAPSPVIFDWLMQGPELVAESEKDMRFRLVNGGKSCPFAIAATTPFPSRCASRRPTTAGSRSAGASSWPPPLSTPCASPASMRPGAASSRSGSGSSPPTRPPLS